MDFLERWYGLYGEVIRFCDAVASLPEECPCGDADGHLDGRCPCCGEHSQTSPAAHARERCAALLESLRAAVAMLDDDFRRAVAPLAKAGSGGTRFEVRHGVFLAASDLERLVRALDDVHETAVGFRRTCAATELGRFRRATATLRGHCDSLTTELQGGLAGPASE